MTVFVDMDGVVAEIVEYWLARYNQDYRDNLRYEDCTSYGLENIVKPECGIHIQDYLNELGFFARARVIDGSVEALREIQAAGHEIFFATHSPKTSKTAYYEKCSWVDRHFSFIGGDRVIAIKNKGLLEGSFMVDDKPENLLRFAGWRLLFDQPWNRGFKERDWRIQLIRRCKGWKEVKEKILSCE